MDIYFAAVDGYVFSPYAMLWSFLMSNRAWFAKIAALAIFMIGIASDLHAQGRVALVIGNGDYVYSESLPNPPNDASDMAASLKRLGFSVIQVSNGTYNDIRQAIRTFNIQVQGADIGLIYYAGHGMELGGENWLIPVDADLKTDLDLANEAVNLKTLMQSVSRATGLGLIILDACRDNPFAAKMARSKLARSVERGFARVEPATNVLVAYAAKDGTTAKDGSRRNSPYTAALLRNLERPSLEVSYLFRSVRDEVMANTNREQQPFVYGSLSSKAIYLNQNAPAPPADLAAAPQSLAKSADETIWLAIRESNDSQLLRDFVTKFPDSSHGGDAMARLEGLQFANECDRLAGTNIDRDRARTVAIIADDDTASNAATTACDQAMRTFPAIPRFAFQAGRAAEARKDYSAARGYYEKASAAGNGTAMLRLGLLYSESDRLPADYPQARRWYEKAVEQGIPSAMLNLGILYESGRGGPQDFAKAYDMYGKAAAAGDRSAMKNLGKLYETGQGVHRDYDEAHRWYEKAAALGNWPAMISIGKLYEHGLGVPKSTSDARAWYLKAANAKSADKTTPQLGYPSSNQ